MDPPTKLFDQYNRYMDHFILIGCLSIGFIFVCVIYNSLYPDMSFPKNVMALLSHYLPVDPTNHLSDPRSLADVRARMRWSPAIINNCYIMLLALPLSIILYVCSSSRYYIINRRMYLLTPWRLTVHQKRELAICPLVFAACAAVLSYGVFISPPRIGFHTTLGGGLIMCVGMVFYYISLIMINRNNILTEGSSHDLQ